MFDDRGLDNRGYYSQCEIHEITLAFMESTPVRHKSKNDLDIQGYGYT
jgi:hypothetical protein